MPLQTFRLRMAALGIADDAPPDPAQPKLVDGMHLRWGFHAPVGFPWYGYYLFRRPAKEHGRYCLSEVLRRLKPGVLNSPYSSPLGTLVSDRGIQLVDEFDPAGVVEVSLEGRSFLRFDMPPGEVAWRFEAKIGFRKAALTCIDFDDLRFGAGPNPLAYRGASFTIRDNTGQLRPDSRIVAEQVGLALDAGHFTEIRLPCPASSVQLTWSHHSEPPTVTALTATDKVVDKVQATQGKPHTITLKGRRIVKLAVEAPANETRLHRLCFRCPPRGDDRPPRIRVTGLDQNTPVAVTEVAGTPGDVVLATLEADSMTSVEFSSGPAVLIDLCAYPVSYGISRGWEKVPGFKYPLCLTVAHPDYPCPGKPPSKQAARNTAMGRVVYDDPAHWQGGNFDTLHEQLETLVVNGPPPMGDPMATRSADVPGVPPPPAGVTGNFVHQHQRPLDLVLLGAINPSMAQAVGLYWVDESAPQGVALDYLILADHENEFAGDPDVALAWLQSPNFSVVDGFVVFNKTVQPRAPLAAPTNLHAFALAGTTVARHDSNQVRDATNSVGFLWDARPASGVIQDGQAILFHIWGADLGPGDAEPAQPDDPAYQLVTKQRPVAVTEPHATLAATPSRPSPWPTFPLHFIDTGRPEGWYSYKINGIDLFGRYTLRSVPAEWHQWTPMPVPKPWYYLDPPGGPVVNASFIRLLDKVPPPAPTGVEAFALDPDDPTVFKDAAYDDWWDSLSAAERGSVIGLRVRWIWTGAHMRQAPDTREFRVYLQPGQPNVRLGTTSAVTPVSATESLIDTDIANGQPAGTFTDLWVRVGGDAFKVLASQAGDPLRLRVRNIGPEQDTRPRLRAPCSLAIPPSHALFVDYSEQQAWQDRFYVVGFDEHVTVSVDAAGRPLRRYEVFVPAPGDANRNGVPLDPTLESPIRYANVGVSAADDKTHTHDPRGNPQRFGNEGPVAGPVAIYRLLREPPLAPEAPSDSDKVFASPADYHARSFYTFRWKGGASLRTHIFRALDESLFKADFAQRPRGPLDTADTTPFPKAAVEPRWDEAKRQQVAAELDQLDGFDTTTQVDQAMAYYRQLSNDALRVLAALPGNERAFAQLTIQPLDPEEPDADAPDGLRWRRVGLDVTSGTLDPQLRAYVDALDGRSRNRYFYRCAYVDLVGNVGPQGISSPPVWLPDVQPPGQPRLLKALGGDRSVTLLWGAQADPGLRRFQIYRAQRKEDTRDLRLFGAAVADLPARPIIAQGDEADLGAGTDVVMIERVYDAAGFDPKKDFLTEQTTTHYLAAPAAPNGTKAVGLTAPDGVEVVIVYTDGKGGLQHSPCGNKPRRWVDAGLVGARTYYYRITSNRVGETADGPVTVVSPPSEVGGGRAVDLTPPDPPAWTLVEWVRADDSGNVFPFADPVPAGQIRRPTVALAWDLGDPTLTSLVQVRRQGQTVFSNLTGWQDSGTESHLARGLSPSHRYRFRIYVLSQAGNRNTTFDTAVLNPVVAI